MIQYFPIILALWLMVAPFPASEPHLKEKLRWLKEKKPFKPIDWFDLFLHSVVPIMLILYTLKENLGY